MVSNEFWAMELTGTGGDRFFSVLSPPYSVPLLLNSYYFSFLFDRQFSVSAPVLNETETSR